MLTVARATKERRRTARVRTKPDGDAAVQELAGKKNSTASALQPASGRAVFSKSGGGTFPVPDRKSVV